MKALLFSTARFVRLLAAGLLGLVVFEASRARLRLGNPSVLTGWALFGLLVLLASFNARKRLSMLPLGSASTWLLIHVVGGLLAVALFWLHAGVLWPTGLYEQALTLLFYAVSVSGLIGYGLQRLYPPRLTHTGLEVIYEQIPVELADLRERAEAVILACTKATGTDTLAQHYLQTLSWFFLRPRFFSNHALGGSRGDRWVQYQCDTVRRYLNAAERGYLDQLAALAQTKNTVDVHYAVQSVMKGWLLVHIPLAVAVMALALWHLLLVHLFAL